MMDVDGRARAGYEARESASAPAAPKEAASTTQATEERSRHRCDWVGQLQVVMRGERVVRCQPGLLDDVGAQLAQRRTRQLLDPGNDLRHGV